VRTTLSLDDDAIDVIRAHARTNQLSMGRAASELIRRGVCYQLRTRKLNGLPVFDAPDDFPAITTERVRELLDEE
jgi:hypothetical protein